MAVAVLVPKAGDAVVEGRIAQWFVADGAAVNADQPLFELETDKLTVPVPAPTAGVLKQLAKVGDVVAVESVVAEIDPDGTPSAPAEKPATPATKPAAKAEPRLSPAAAATVRDNDLDASKIAGSGPHGIITKDDTAKAMKPAPSAPLAVAPATRVSTDGLRKEERQPMSMIRRRIAQRLLESQSNTATLTTFNEVDMSALMELRARYNEKFEKKHGIKLGFMSVFVKAAIEALKAFPVVNARIDGTDVVYQSFFDIGVAVSTEKGLTVPVLKGADGMGFAEIEKAIGVLAKKARDGKLTADDMSGGTFTITNGGIFGSMLSTPILNPPQTGILGMHNIVKRPVVVNDEIVIRPIMYVALSYDHRLIDGREAVQFLVRIKECVENPERMLFGV
jgi:2-oxoglutarate dehydrogenase E2 component (dihydrolipoamide succinyltransferase)